MMMREEQFQEVIDFGNLLKTKLDNYNIEWVPLFDDISTVVGPWEYGEEWMKEFFKTHSFDSQQRRQKARGSKWSMASKEVYEDGTEQAFNGNRLTDSFFGSCRRYRYCPCQPARPILAAASCSRVGRRH
jgi:hypothetical protein